MFSYREGTDLTFPVEALQIANRKDNGKRHEPRPLPDDDVRGVPLFENEGALHFMEVLYNYKILECPHKPHDPCPPLDGDINNVL